MGLRAASVRHPDAVVMAPALTEAGQSQNFTIPPSSPINSVSRNGGGYVSHDEDAHSCKRSTLKGKCVFADDLFETSNECVSEPQPPATSATESKSPRRATAPADDNMSASPPSVGGMDAMASLLKDVDLMQVIKNMDAVERPPTADATDAETLFPIPFDKELFSEDVMQLCEQEQEQLELGKNQCTKEVLEALERRQATLERRSDVLNRKLRKLQARYMGVHVSGEIAGLYEHVHHQLELDKSLSSASSSRTSTAPSESDTGTPGPGPGPSPGPEPTPGPSTMLSPSSSQPIEASTVRGLVRKLEMSTILQANSYVRQKQGSRYFGSGSVDHSASTTMRAITGSTVVSSLPAESCDELDRMAGTLHSNFSMLERQMDSDATASSSGGESCDEMQSFNNPQQQYLAINKRAAWRYANDRASVAARWTWLQAQISDLEYRIRLHNELHRQIRASKGVVTLNATAAVSVSAHGGPGTVNGYRGQLPGATKPVAGDELLVNGAAVSNTGCSSARTRPLNRTNFRKRKLLQTTGLHTVTKKAARPSNIRCGCVPPTVPCALCTGRTDPTFPRDLPEQLTVPERIALLDPGYHPVLSFSDDISMSIHLEAVMKLPDWQQKCMRSSVKTLKTISKSERTDKLTGGLDRSKKSEHRKKYNRLLKTNSPSPLTGKIKPRVGRGRRSMGRGGSAGRRRLPSGMSASQLQSLSSESVDEEMEALGMAAGTSKSESLTPSPLSHVHVVPYKRSRVDSYDIDNIVIPYSVAASTRVEKLQYKEILTPKWRVIDSDFPSKYDVKNNGLVRRVSQDSDIEDISEEVIFARHEKCEYEEKKKFLSYLKLPTSSSRSRGNRRTDSRAESSGANTPDPMSPHPAETAEATGSPLTSPPATPMPVQAEEGAHAQHNPMRRRTVSQSRWLREQREDAHSATVLEHVETAPYELRAFPLADDVYEHMLKSMPEGHGVVASRESVGSDRGGSPYDADSRPDSPASDSTESVVPDEDPNDPEWLGAERSRDRSKR